MRVFMVLMFLASFFSINAQQTTLPSVILKDMDGKAFNISDLAKEEKPVILSFWATWCGPCLKELAAINDVYEEWQKETGVKLVAVSIDDAKSVKRVKPLINGKGWEYQVLLDQNHELKRAMNVVNVPFTAVIYKGKIVYKHTSYTPGIEKELFKQVKAALKN
ncbi:TlpA disulfide reductase family protein [Myroides sp. DF42-4-2]|uniref:TlpA family protein disulfide reductase n=1 Tax=unclassified Myroides TaxID=2642485 RepID=UPI002578EECC|nr:TlpA disulfide reductase family protein [Myroides sp. DF42-4-2]MDM1406807.1 TlpA family protein disulfide reductase [Myroides sp. DF42-4-2]